MLRLFFILSFCFLHFTTVVGCGIIESTVSSNITDLIFFLFFKGPTFNDYTVIPYKDGLSISKQENFNANLNTVFYMPGWGEKPQNSIESTNTIAQAYLDATEKNNLVILDYSELIKSNIVLDYISAVDNTTKIGAALGYFLQQYIPEVQPNEKVHLVSHSLGSQIMSKTAKSFGQGKLFWLTALDPAGPLFQLPTVEHLNKKDGQFLDVIHTDSNFYGDGRAIGHIDFFPNYGTRVQPACQKNLTDDFCSHHMSWRYYAASITNRDEFPAKNCTASVLCFVFGSGRCCNSDTKIAYMGAGVNRTSYGDSYYLKTTKQYPYGLGDKGLDI